MRKIIINKLTTKFYWNFNNRLYDNTMMKVKLCWLQRQRIVNWKSMQLYTYTIYTDWKLMSRYREEWEIEYPHQKKIKKKHKDFQISIIEIKNLVKKKKKSKKWKRWLGNLPNRVMAFSPLLLVYIYFRYRVTLVTPFVTMAKLKFTVWVCVYICRVYVCLKKEEASHVR